MANFAKEYKQKLANISRWMTDSSLGWVPSEWNNWPQMKDILPVSRVLLFSKQYQAFALRAFFVKLAESVAASHRSLREHAGMRQVVEEDKRSFVKCYGGR